MKSVLSPFMRTSTFSSTEPGWTVLLLTEQRVTLFLRKSAASRSLSAPSQRRTTI